jgi:DNA sulfur modification protein DndD
MNDFEDDLSNLVLQLEGVQGEIDDIEDELKNTEAIQRKSVEINLLQTQRKSTESRLYELEGEHRELLKAVWQDVLFQNISPVIKNMEKRRDILQESIAKKAVHLAKINDLKDSLNNSNCYACGQEIPINSSEDIKAKIQQIQAAIDLIDDNPRELLSLNSSISNLTRIKSQGEIERLMNNLKDQRKQRIGLVGIDTDIDELNDEIKGFDSKHIMGQRDKKDQLMKLKGKIENDINVVNENIRKNNSEQDQIATLISRSKVGRNQESSIRVNTYKALEEIFSEGINKLRDSLKGEVEKFASNAFLEITTEKTYSGLNINQNYGLSILDQGGRILNERSAGAEQVVALSLIDGLNKTARKSGPIIMDTPLGRLDPKHRFNVLKYLPNMAQQVILLVHDGEIDPVRDIENIADRVGARYKIERISATESKLVKSN